MEKQIYCLKTQILLLISLYFQNHLLMKSELCFHSEMEIQIIDNDNTLKKEIKKLQQNFSRNVLNITHKIFKKKKIIELLFTSG